MTLSVLPYGVPQVDTVYVWMAVVGLLLALLGGAFLYLLAQRNRNWLGAQYARLDAWLQQRAPAAWHFTKQRFSRGSWYGLTLTLAVALFAGTVYGFVGITESWVDEDALYELDQAVQEGVAGALSAGQEAALRAVTHFGALPVALGIGAVLAVYFLYRRQRWRVLALVLVLGVGEGILWTLKGVFSRTRPGEQLTSAVGYSFPSGHAFTAMVLYGFLIYLTWRTTDRQGVRLSVTLALALLILLVGLSRVLLSVHWVSDVLGGYTIGLAWLVCALVAARALQAYGAHRLSSGEEPTVNRPR